MTGNQTGSGDDGAGASSSTRRIPWIPILSGLLGAAIAFGVAALVWGGSNGPATTNTSASTTSTTAGSGGALSGQALRLQKLLTAGNTVTYHATYTLTTTDPQAAGGQVNVEVWRKPPQERQDSSAIVTGSPATHEEDLESSSGLVNCTQSGTGNWACTSEGNVLPSGPDAIVRQITASLAGDTVTVHSSTIAKLAAQCFNLAGGSTSLSLCVDKEGIPLEVTDGTNTLMATELDHTVAKAVFTPPAPVSAATTTTTAAST